GTGRISAQDVIAEIGVDMTIFPTAAHLVSWAKWCPQVAQSGGKRKGSNAAGRGNPYLSAALGEITISAGRTQSFLGAKYRRLVKRMPKKKALVATGNSVLTPPPATTTLAPTTTSNAPASAARPATTSETSNASATTSPFRPSTQTPANSSHQPPDNNPPGAGGADAPPAAAASPAKVSFSDQSLNGARSREFTGVHAAAQIPRAYFSELHRTRMNSNPNCNPGFFQSS